jgi:hypothetical protein
MRDAYLRAVTALELTSREHRLRLARTIIRLHRLERFPDPAQLAALAIEWYRTSQARST